MITNWKRFGMLIFDGNNKSIYVLSSVNHRHTDITNPSTLFNIIYQSVEDILKTKDMK